MKHYLLGAGESLRTTYGCMMILHTLVPSHRHEGLKIKNEDDVKKDILIL